MRRPFEADRWWSRLALAEMQMCGFGAGDESRSPLPSLTTGENKRTTAGAHNREISTTGTY